MAYENNTGFPSVSDIIRPYIDTQWFTEESAMRGTAIHACCASYIQGLYFPKLKPEYQGYMDSFKKWADKNIEEVLLVEKRLVDKDLGYCGQLDAVLKLKNHEKPCIVDWKTGKALQKSWILSIAAYAALEAHRQQLGIDAYDCISVRLRCEQKPPLVHKYSDNQDNFDIFKGMLKTFQFFKRKGAK
jgi:hypothetical protein